MDHHASPFAKNPENRMRVIVAATAIVTLVGVSLSVSGPLLSLEMERWGTSTTLAGATSTMAGLGNLITVAFVPRLARVLGVKRLMSIMLVIAAALHFAFWFFPSLWIWGAFRFVLGGAIGTLFVLSEYWISSAADPRHRGLVMGAYATALAIGFAIGPLLLTMTGTVGFWPYLATALIILTGALPLLLIGQHAPTVEGKAKASILSYVRIAPVATFAALTVGALEIGGFTQLPIHGLRLGLSETQAAMLVTAFAIGSVIFQIPVGILSDRFDRRIVILCVAIGASALALSLLFTSDQLLLTWMALIGLGGLVGALYTVGLAHLSSRFSDVDLVSANSAFVMLYSVGQMVGPPLIGAGIDVKGVYGLPSVMAGLLLAYAAIVIGRIIGSQSGSPQSGR
ncbi:AraJ Arabinose efflux permease [Rhabdaerophilaceae bacterium]